jgi:hypothetical protein
MATYEELLAAVKLLRDRTGDPNAWQQGLAPAEVAAVVTPTTRPQQLDAILGKIRQQHSDLFDAGLPTGRPQAATSPDSETGEAADGIVRAEAALAQQNSASSQLDMQVVSAILNAHLKTTEGSTALNQLQRETEAAVRTRSDLDTPAGARDFQRFLIGKLRDIRAIVLDASLDDTSKSALMAAWTSLYSASKSGTDGSAGSPAVSEVPGGAPARGSAQQSLDDPDTEWDPLLDALLAGDPGPAGADPPGLSPAELAAAPSAPPLAMPTIPTLGAGTPPGPGMAPGALSGWGSPFGGPRDDGYDPALRDPDDEELLASQDADSEDHASPAREDDEDHNKPDTAEVRSAGPITVTLPNGETVTAASPQLGAAIQAAVDGAPIAEAFHQQGITLPPPGTAVTDPIDPFDLTPGDIGMFTDRHALALGPGKALLDGQIQHIATVSGPGFLGWEHPPAATAGASAPAGPDAPTPTRPAARST